MSTQQINGATQIQNATITTTQISATAGILQTQLAAWTQNQSASGYLINNLGTPATATDAATKGYVDSVAQGLYPKAACAAASIVNATVTYATTGGLNSAGQITAAPNIVDGVTLAVGSRVLLTGQTTQTQNGIWQVATVGTGSTGVWNRPTDFCNGTVVNTGDWTIVDGGTANGGTSYFLSTTGTIVIDTASATSLAFSKLSSVAVYTAGNGISISSNVVSVALNGSSSGLQTTGGLSIVLNGATLALGTSGLSVASGGITSTQLGAGSVTSTALNSSALGGGLTGGSGTVVTPWYAAETPSGTINGSNTAFTLAHTFYSQTGSATDATAIQLYVDGLLQIPTTHYTVATSNTITFSTAPASGSNIWVTYFRAS